jgi:hypothetical protein
MKQRTDKTSQRRLAFGHLPESGKTPASAGASQSIEGFDSGSE